MLGESAAPKDEETEDDDADVIDDIPMENVSRPRTSVSAEAYGTWNKKKAFTPPKHPKSDEQRKRIRETFGKNFMFKTLAETEIAVVLDAVEEAIVPKGERIIK